MARLTDFVKPKVSFKKGTKAFKKRKRIAEGIARRNPVMPIDRKFRLATAAVKKHEY